MKKPELVEWSAHFKKNTDISFEWRPDVPYWAHRLPPKPAVGWERVAIEVSGTIHGVTIFIQSPTMWNNQPHFSFGGGHNGLDAWEDVKEFFDFLVERYHELAEALETDEAEFLSMWED